MAKHRYVAPDFAETSMIPIVTGDLLPPIHMDELHEAGGYDGSVSDEYGDYDPDPYGPEPEAKRMWPRVVAAFVAGAALMFSFYFSGMIQPPGYVSVPAIPTQGSK